MTSLAIPALMAITTGGNILSGYEESSELKRQASATEQVAGVNAAAKRREVEQSLGSSLAAYSASGIDMSSGSALDALGQAAGQGELDAQNIMYEGRVQASNLRSRAKSAKSAGYINAASSLLGNYSTFGKASNFMKIGG